MNPEAPDEYGQFANHGQLVEAAQALYACIKGHPLLDTLDRDQLAAAADALFNLPEFNAPQPE